MDKLKSPEAALKFCVSCNEAAAKWWINIDTGKKLDRNVGEMLALIHSEITEAYEGWVENKPDDHLPNRQSVEVELADVMIRTGDILIGLNADVHGIWRDFELSYIPKETKFSEVQTLTDFMTLHSVVSYALEGYRKNSIVPAFDGKYSVFELNLVALLAGCGALGEILGLDVNGAIDDKQQYNANRADHKIENRRKSGGKKI